MEILIGLGILGLLLTSLIMPWIHRVRIKKLGAEIEQLQNQVVWLVSFAQGKGADIPQRTLQEPKPTYSAPVEASPIPQLTENPTKPDDKKQIKKPKKKISFEQQFGARLPVWVGGIALALAGFFLVKYSIETGLLTESVRTILGSLFGIGLIYAGQWVRNRPHIANSKPIAQALSGAGIADLYICVFAATSLYHLITPWVGFAGMAVVTATAVVLSLRHGAPVALLGLVGGFLTPALVGSSEPNVPLLFIYLYCVLTGLFAVIRKQNWWFLAVPTVFGAFLWVVFWVETSVTPSDSSMWLGLFLVAMSATVVLHSKGAIENGTADLTKTFKFSSVLNYFSLGGAVLLMGAVVVKSGFGFMEWGLFGLLAAGGIVLAYFNHKLYGFVPWVSMAANAVMLAVWTAPGLQAFATTLTLFAVLYCASGYFLMWHSKKPLLWAGITGATSVGYYLLAYYQIYVEMGIHTLFNPGHWAANIPVWGTIALGLSLLATHVTREVLTRYEDRAPLKTRFQENNDGAGPDPKTAAYIEVREDLRIGKPRQDSLKVGFLEVPGDETSKQWLLAIFAVAATAFLSIGLTIELKREFLSVAFATQVLAISWINTRVDIKALRPVIGLLACIFGFLLVPQILLLIQLTAYSLVEAKFNLQEGIPIVNWPLFQLGTPALMFVGASVLLRKQKEDRLIQCLEVAAIALVGVMGYYLTRHAFHVNEDVLFVKAGFTERGVVTNILFLYGLACFWIGRRFGRSAVSLSGMVLSGIALFRIAYFDLVTYNPLWSHQVVGNMPLLNALILPYGLPVIWLYIANKELKHLGKNQYLRYTNGFLLALVFAYVSFNVRQWYQGEYLDGVVTTNMEIYTYSVAWLLVGIGLLFFGTLRRDKMVRIASLVVMILTAGKVFLYDASELEGLFRVFSFLGLGISLIGLSWFYTRFVFGDRMSVGRQEQY